MPFNIEYQDEIVSERNWKGEGGSHKVACEVCVLMSAFLS